MKVAQKLMQARIDLQATKLKKTGKNDYSKYSYFELEDFLPTVQNIFHKLGLCGIVSFTKEKATLTIIDVDGDGCLEVSSPMADAQLKAATPVQNLGAVHTYLRRYLWVTAMEIVEHDALDSTVQDVVVNIEEASKQLQDCKTVEELTATYTIIIQNVKDANTIKVLKQIATKKKGELNEAK